ncbi:MAG TPA: ATP-binding cassette domain-containing protein, partial [Acidimicrobiales bacterium]|nr:ATP-binding cassette domain-containing protein [Acidimicrobiales bacterium]
MTPAADFSVPDELLASSAVAPARRRGLVLNGTDATTRGLASLAAGSVMLGTAAPALGALVLAAALVVGVVSLRAVGNATPSRVRRRTVTGFVGGAIGGVIAGLVAASAVDEAQGPGFVVALALLASAGGFGLLFYARSLASDLADRTDGATDRKPVATPAALEVRGLDFAYGSQQVLFDVSITVEQGEIAALLGTNGAGKSTILRAVAGLDPPVAASIRLFGEDITFMDAADILRRGVALLAGGRMTFPSLTVHENLRVGAYSTAGARVDEVYERFPALASRRQQRAGTLSGGEQQMLALGRVLLTQPRLLLIDELTLGLAPKVVEQLIDVLRDVNAQ